MSKLIKLIVAGTFVIHLQACMIMPIPKNSISRDSIGSMIERASSDYNDHSLTYPIVEGYPLVSKELQSIWHDMEQRLKDETTTKARIKKLQKMGMNCFYVMNRTQIECRYRVVAQIHISKQEKHPNSKYSLFSIIINPEIGINSIVFMTFNIDEMVIKRREYLTSADFFDKDLLSPYMRNFNNVEKRLGKKLGELYE